MKAFLPTAIVASLMALAGVLLVGGGCCSLARAGATPRQRKHFDLTRAEVASPEAIEAALARKVPPGTTEEDLLAFLRRSRIGADPLSSVSVIDDPLVPRVVARVEFDPRTLGLVKEHYALIFTLDGNRRVATMVAKKWFTGL